MQSLKKTLASRVMQVLLATLSFLLCIVAGVARANTYEAPLPAELKTAKDMCALVDCRSVFPGASSFSERMGQPPYVEAYGEAVAGKKPLLGYVMLSTDITDMPAYSGKPVVTLIGMDIKGRFVGVKVIKHSEPILLLGIPESALINFNHQYLGKSVKDKIQVGQSKPEEGVLGVDAISGATVTVMVQNQVLTTSAATIAREVGILAPVVRAPVKYATSGKLYNWQELVKQGSVQRLLVNTQQLGLEKSAEPFIELWFGDLNHPDIGKSLIGESVWNNLRSQLHEGEHALFIIRTAGKESFKGSGFVRGGMYDRVQVKQGSDSYTFRDLDYRNLYGITADGAPSYTESAIFIIRSKSFSEAYPWKLSLLGNRVDRATGTRSFTTFDASYWLADELLVGGRPEVDDDSGTWKRIWKSKKIEIALFALLLIAVTVVYALRDQLTRRATHKNKWPVNIFKYSAWALSISFLGFGLMAQPSVTQVLTWFHSLLFQWTWSLFLTDPFIFLFWIFIITTVFLFGRGLFCGWMCPFGSLSEAIYKFGSIIGLKRLQRHLPKALHDKLKWIKYAIFFGLLTVSMFSMGLAEKLAEIEPFKTTFLVGITHRAWPYGLFVCTLLGISLFVERPYCKYICPLGAALAVPSTFRWSGLRRKQDCNSCKACAAGCGSLAIDADGRIDHRECLHCLDCMVLYTDVKACPPLVKERKRRERENLPMQSIGRDGYFIPIYPVDSKVKATPDPRMPTDPVTPPYQDTDSVFKWIISEIIDHLWPWSSKGWSTQRTIQVTGVLVALAASVAWVMTAMGNLSSGAIIAWWFGWSVYEVLIRLSGRRYVKDGPWWKRNYRYASVMDMLSYVSFKNLLIGATLFLTLKALGLLVL